jgi:catechol 2,3-dioxygenase-like lactoylglutathione lyase family enzyme
MTHVQFRDALMILDVRDLESALRYYCEELGFELDFRNAEAPDNYAGIRRGNVLLHMQWQSEDAFRTGTAGHLRVRIDVNDPDALYAEYQQRGVQRLGPEPKDTGWGTREFAFRDPDGNHLAFFVDH